MAACQHRFVYNHGAARNMCVHCGNSERNVLSLEAQNGHEFQKHAQTCHQSPFVSRNDGEKPDLPPDALEIIGHLDKEFAGKERILRIQLQDAETKNHSLVDMVDSLRQRVSRYRVDVERANQLADKCALFEACNVTQGERIADLESFLRVAKRTETALRDRIRKLERR